jgi:hypothetical protein
MQGNAGTQQTRAHAQRTHSSLAPLSVSSAASEAVEAAAEGTRAQSYSQWLGFAFGQPGRHVRTHRIYCMAAVEEMAAARD